jgi:hypothetical protein
MSLDVRYFRAGAGMSVRGASSLGALLDRGADDRTVALAQISALNKATAKARTGVVRDLALSMGTPQRLIRKRVTYYRAALARRFTKLWVGLKKGITVEDWPKLARTPHAFMATMPNGRRSLYRRKPGWRHQYIAAKRRTHGLPIERVALRPTEAAARQALTAAVAKVRALYRPLLARELEWRLKKKGAR